MFNKLRLGSTLLNLNTNNADTATNTGNDQRTKLEIAINIYLMSGNLHLGISKWNPMFGNGKK